MALPIEPSPLLLFASATLLLNLTPGPDLLYTISRAAGQGWRSGVAAACGNFCGTLLQTAAVVLGLAAVLSASAAAFEIARWLGVAYLLYLGVRAWREGSSVHEESVQQDGKRGPASFRRVMAEAFVIHTLNPKVVLFFLAFLPQFLEPSRGPGWSQLAFLGLWFAGQTFVTLALLSLVADRVGTGFRSRPGLVTLARRACGVLFVGLGARLALSARG